MRAVAGMDGSVGPGMISMDDTFVHGRNSFLDTPNEVKVLPHTF